MHLQGIVDFHTHPGPDVVERKFSDRELAQRCRDTGMAGFVIKNHFAETAARAAIVSQSFPDLTIVGGVVLNNSVGGLNPEAVHKSADMGAKIVWMPTMDALSFQRIKNPTKDHSGYITVLNDADELTAEAKKVVEAVRDRNLVLSTGHLSARESLKLLRYAADLGVNKLVVTHADNCNNEFSVEEQQECVRLGAVIEHSYFMVFHGRTSMQEMARQIRDVGAEHVILDTDFGQPESDFPDEGMSAFIDGLLAEGFTKAELLLMTRDNPLQLMA